MNRSIVERLEKLEYAVFRPADLEAIRPPETIITAINGEREHTEEDVLLTAEWMKIVGVALERETVTLQEVLDALPVPFRSEVINDLRRMINAEKEEKSSEPICI